MTYELGKSGAVDHEDVVDVLEAVVKILRDDRELGLGGEGVVRGSADGGGGPGGRW